ncbi:MAG: DUF3592 domain-containing protein [Woeseiaceae bacterium]|nr:DUF3592 domain-containing protein [Woeseiaceae bacterium]
MKKSAQVSFGTGPAPLRVQIAGFLIVASILATVALWTGVYAWKLDNNGIRTTGIVVESEKSGKASYPVFEFADSLGRTHTVRAAVSTSDYPVGSAVPVIYPGDRPLTARIDDKTHFYAATMITGILSGAFLLGAGLLFKFRATFRATFSKRLGKLRVSRAGPDGGKTQREYSSSPLLTWIARIFGAGAILLAGAAIWTGWQSYEFARSGVKAQGEVIKLIRLGRNHEVHVQFTDLESSSYRAVLPDRSNHYLVGDRIPLIYPTGYPRGVRLRSSSVYFSLPGYFTLLAFVFILVRTMTRIQLAEIEKARRS